MNRMIRFIAIVLVLGTPFIAHADVDLSLGVQGGVWNPDGDDLVRESFAKDFFIRGNFGIIAENGFEVRFGLGRYSDISHHPDDQGTDFTLNVSPLTASLIYHVLPGSAATPYVGGGVGAYFYGMEDAIYGELENGTEFGTHVLGGLKVNFTRNFFIQAQYEKHFIPRIFFANAHNFDSSVLTLGIGIAFPAAGHPSQSQTRNEYRYTRQQEELLVEIQQVKGEIKEIELKKAQIEEEVEEFYLDEDFDEDSDEFRKEYRRVKFLEKKMKNLDIQLQKAQNRLAVLEQKWENLRMDTLPVEEHVHYLHRYHSYSPYGLRYRDGFFVYSSRPYVHRYYVYNNGDSNGGTSDDKGSTVEERKEYYQKKKEYLQQKKNRGRL